VQALHVELCIALQLHKSHRRPGRRLGDRLRIPVIILLGLHVGPHVFGRHQPDLVALLAQDTAEVVRAAAGLHRHDAGGQPRCQLDHPVPAEAPLEDSVAGRVQAHHAAAVLAEVDPQDRDLHQSRSFPPLPCQPSAAGKKGQAIP
jgi:hypothetical protein